jgi:hypothetical protein
MTDKVMPEHHPWVSNLTPCFKVLEVLVPHRFPHCLSLPCTAWLVGNYDSCQLAASSCVDPRPAPQPRGISADLLEDRREPPDGGNAGAVPMVPIDFLVIGVKCMASLGWLTIAKQVSKPIFFISDKVPISPCFAAHKDIDAVV